MFEIAEKNEFQEGAKIKVVGVGGGGCNAVNTMIKAGLSGVEYIVANTDSQALAASLAATKVQLGVDITKGLGAGANPEVGRKAALDEYEKLGEVLQGADMVFVTAGMGGGTGTGAAPVIAKLSKELGALTVGVVTKPFLFEGKKRSRQAEAGIETLEENVDSLITIPNQRLLYIAGENLSLVDTFKKADEVLLNAVRGISDLINNTGHINADFADVSTVMANKGLALMGTGFASGQDRAIKAATEAISSPLLEDITIDGATGIIINITGDENLTMFETNEAVTLIMEAADDDAEIIFGTVIDDSMEDQIKITVIATGLGGEERVLVSSSRRQTRSATDAIMNTGTSSATETTTVEAEASGISVENSISAEEVSRERETYSFGNEREESAPTSELVNNIKKAANEYRESVTPAIQPTQGRAEQKTETTNESTPKVRRARSIAEKLGFINFDEEELDTPTFLRNEERDKSEARPRSNERPMDA